MDQGDEQAHIASLYWDLDWPALEEEPQFSREAAASAPIPLAQYQHQPNCVAEPSVLGSFPATANLPNIIYGIDEPFGVNQYHVPPTTLALGQTPSAQEQWLNQAPPPLAPHDPRWGAFPGYLSSMTDYFPASGGQMGQDRTQNASGFISSFSTPFLGVSTTTREPTAAFAQRLLPAEPGHPSQDGEQGKVSKSGTSPKCLPPGVRIRTSVARSKPRLPCSYPGCLLTFPRPFELDRHLRYFHQRTTRILCSIFDCDRNSNPMHRVDKFFEHVRKAHPVADRFLCIVELCRQGPLSRDELVQHLNAQHPLVTLDQPDLEESLNSLNLGGTTRVGHQIVVDIASCPLRFQGCDFFASPKKGGMAKMLEHVQRHDLLERSNGYRAIVGIFGFWDHCGVVECPICKKNVCKRRNWVYDFVRHLFEKHTVESCKIHAVELAQRLWPFLLGMEPGGEVWKHYGPRLIAHFREAGVVVDETLEPYPNSSFTV